MSCHMRHVDSPTTISSVRVALGLYTEGSCKTNASMWPSKGYPKHRGRGGGSTSPR
ncbi:hypothetical protein PR202_ga16975 [Eleusine coracana subsp. coracana]|uniref:Uncharacterized protein n=1 Tax=Eleusine coracana subsp. coracana TaxID=191504 RepID=A0AAV5CNZ3_ELECO|nr:hypothetical protein PR202_ga16975 [Eleusine coracana subsp. coracana]